MQWNAGKNAGFTTGTPWLPVPQSAATHNVQTEMADPDSVLQFYKHLLALRHSDKALLDGEYIPLNADDPNTLAYLRKYEEDTILVVLNMSSQPQRVSLASPSIPTGNRTPLLATTSLGPESQDSRAIQMDPYSVYIARIVP